MTTLDQASYRLCPRVRFRRVDNEGVFVLQESGEVLVVNDTGARIVELLKEGQNLQNVSEQIAALYELDVDVAQRDVRNMVEELLNARAIEGALS